MLTLVLVFLIVICSQEKSTALHHNLMFFCNKILDIEVITKNILSDSVLGENVILNAGSQHVLTNNVDDCVISNKFSTLPCKKKDLKLQ
jgi:hypothetical protein